MPVTVTRIILAASSTAENAWGADVFAWYALAFIVGYLLYTDDRFIASVRRDLYLALIVAVIGSAALIAAGYSQWVMSPKTYGITYLIIMSLAGVTGWAWTLTILSWGMRAEFMQRRLAMGIGEAALPLYVLHYPILFGIAALVIQSPLSLEAKVLVNEVLVVGTSLLVTLIVLRISVLRPLLGLRSPAPITVSRPLEPGREVPPAEFIGR